MDKQRKNFTLSLDVIEFLDRQSNKSGAVEEGVRLLMKHKETIRRLAGSVERIEEQLNKQPAVRTVRSGGQPCCEEFRPDPQTEAIPCKHWFYQDEKFTNVLTGESVEV